jgi:hypothetical protein
MIQLQGQVARITELQSQNSKLQAAVKELQDKLKEISLPVTPQQ